jgi:heme exporter protein A
MTLTVTNLSCARGGLTVLSGVSFKLEPGQTLVLQGPNGIGKTTLLRTIAGLQPPQSGQITAPADSIAYAAHADGIKPTLSVYENLAFWAAIFGTQNIAPALNAMQLTALQSRPAATLSAGQKRRLGLARLLVTGRPVWLLDEPTVSLDAASTALFATMITAHLGQGGSALIASHIDLGLAHSAKLDLTSFASSKAPQPSPFDGVTA